MPELLKKTCEFATGARITADNRYQRRKIRGTLCLDCMCLSGSLKKQGRKGWYRGVGDVAQKAIAELPINP